MALKAFEVWLVQEQSRAERRKMAVSRLKEIAEEFPDLIEDLITTSVGTDAFPTAARSFSFSVATRVKPHVHRDPDAARENLRRVEQVLQRHPDGLLMRAIGEQAGLERSAVRHVIENLYPDRFEAVSAPNSVRAKLWKVKRADAEFPEIDLSDMPTFEPSSAPIDPADDL